MPTYTDAEDLTQGWIRDVLLYKNVTNEVPTNVVDLIRTDPVVVVARVGGADRKLTMDEPRLDVSVYAGSRDAAKMHGNLIWTALRTRFRGYTNAVVTVGLVGTVQAPIIVPYDSRNVIRKSVGSYTVPLHQYSGV